jgi:RNA polymerase sigma-70 factor (family 1)
LDYNLKNSSLSKYATLSDLELSALLKSSDEEAYSEIYRRYSGTLLIHANNKLSDQDDAQDLVQEIFCALWNNRTELQIRSTLAGYLYTAAQNRVIDRFAHQKIRTKYVASLQKFLDAGNYITEETLRERELTALIDKEIAALPSKMRQVFEFSRKDNFSHREISGILNISEETVKKQVYNALKILKLRLSALFF